MFSQEVLYYFHKVEWKTYNIFERKWNIDTGNYKENLKMP